MDILIYIMHGISSFNEYIYKAMSFDYPCNGHIDTFRQKEISICPASRIEEVSGEEFLDAFLEVDEL